MIGSICSIGGLSFFVYVYYMFIVGLCGDVRVYFSLMIMIIGLFIGIKVFIWSVINWSCVGLFYYIESGWISIFLIFL